jgi:hypothetical protein
MFGIVVLLAADVRSDSLPAPVAGARLIEMGWDEPDTHFMRQHVTAMEQMPFDGCIFHLTYTRPNGKPGNFAWDVWGRRQFEMSDLAPALADLRATTFHRFTENFLRVNVTPGDVDWDDDSAYAAIVHNLGLAARVAHQGHCRGVMLDVEQYQTHLFNYGVQNARHRRSFDSLAVIVRRRGREAMSAMQKEFPGLTLFLTWGYSMPLYQTYGGRSPLSEAPEALLVPFLDGVYDVTSDSTRIVDGHEMSYGYRRPERFRAAADSVRHGVRRIMADTTRYARHSEVAFGIWIDNDSQKRVWDTTQFERNYFTPAGFDSTLRAALAYTDRYVWIYAEQPRWWNDRDSTERLPAAYVNVMRNVRRSLKP